MTNHPITPPPELRRQWLDNDHFPMVTGTHDLLSITRDRLNSVIDQATQWGADQELEACCEWLAYEGHEHEHLALRDARRPKPQTLNNVALQMLGTIERDAHYIPEITDTIRRALEALDD
jgi:hypothetical protein